MDTAKYVTIIPKRLFWVCDTYPPEGIRNMYCFCVDSALAYEPFNNDFGPVDISKIYKFCMKLQSILDTPSLSSYKIFHYTGVSAIKKNNAALMMCAFQILTLNRTPNQALSLFSNIYFPEFRDASLGICTYLCSILNCLKALTKSITLNWFSLSSFDCETYDYYSKLSNGDINWIVPKKLMAFSEPESKNLEYYAKVFKRNGVSAVVRLNRKSYMAEKLRKLGIAHYDLYFMDGTCPSEEVIRKFLAIVETEPGAVAVHCKAGLGRAGTLAACYLMKHYEFSAAEAIAWTRLCRPGSVLGPQQVFLMEIEDTCFKWGEAYKKSLANGSSIFGGKNLEEKIPMRRRSFDLSVNPKFRNEVKEKGQEKSLMNSKMSKQFFRRVDLNDRDAVSPPVRYRKNNTDIFRTSFLNLTTSINFKDHVSIQLASPRRHSLSVAL